MNVVILAAGLGSRLKHLTSDRPKAMVEVAGKPLIGHAFDFINAEKIENIYVIGGYAFEVLREYVEKNPKVKLIKNLDFKKGSTLTIDKVIEEMDDDFLLMNVDHIYPRAMFDKIHANMDSSKIIAMTDSDRELGMDDMKVKTRGEGLIAQISKQLTDFELGYIGMTFIGREMLADYKKNLYAVIEKTEGKANVEAVLDEMSNSFDIATLNLSGMGWHEVDTPEEREQAEKALK